MEEEVWFWMSNADEKKFKNNGASSKRCSKQQGPVPRDWCLDASNAWVIQRVRSGRGSFTNQASGCVSGRFETVNVRFAGVGLGSQVYCRDECEGEDFKMSNV